MQLLEKRRKGRELDSLARKYSRAVMQTLTSPANIQILKQGGTVDDYIELRPLGLALPNLIGIELEIDSNLDVRAIIASGGFQIVPGEPEISYISVSASLPKPFTKTHLERFYDELVEIMRHELEHSTQDPGRIDQITDFAADPFQSKSNMLAYFTTPEEIAGHVTGWMKRAKRRREPVRDVIKREVGYIQQQAEREGMSKKDAQSGAAEILKKFIKYAVERYGN